MYKIFANYQAPVNFKMWHKKQPPFLQHLHNKQMTEKTTTENRPKWYKLIKKAGPVATVRYVQIQY